MSFLGLRMIPLIPLLAAAAWAQSDPNREFVRQAVGSYFRSIDTVRGLTYKRWTERREFDSGGALRSSSRSTTVSEYVDGVRWTYLTERNDIPIDDAAALLARVRQDVAEWKTKPASQRSKTLEETRKRALRETEYLREFADALDFSPLAAARIAGRPARGFSFSPRPGYKPKALEGRVYEGIRGKIWIDEAEMHFVRLEADVFKDVSIGGFLAKVEKGTRFELDQIRIEPDLWVPSKSLVRFDLKVLLLKQVHTQLESRYSAYRRYDGPRFPSD